MAKPNRTEKRTAEILASDASVALKILKLEVLALRCFASSPNQKAVIAAYTALREAQT